MFDGNSNPLKCTESINKSETDISDVFKNRMMQFFSANGTDDDPSKLKTNFLVSIVLLNNNKIEKKSSCIAMNLSSQKKANYPHEGKRKIQSNFKSWHAHEMVVELMAMEETMWKNGSGSYFHIRLNIISS